MSSARLESPIDASSTNRKPFRVVGVPSISPKLSVTPPAASQIDAQPTLGGAIVPVSAPHLHPLGRSTVHQSGKMLSSKHTCMDTSTLTTFGKLIVEAKETTIVSTPTFESQVNALLLTPLAQSSQERSSHSGSAALLDPAKHPEAIIARKPARQTLPPNEHDHRLHTVYSCPPILSFQRSRTSMRANSPSALLSRAK